MDFVVGNTVDGWCGKCKLMLAHTIEAVAKGKVTRTHCNTCGAQHALRSKPPGKSGSTGARSRTARNTTKTVKKPQEIDYKALLTGKDTSAARLYNVSERFQAKEIIRHPVFGIGLVVAVRDPNKIDVGFTEGMKTLVHGGLY